MVKTNAKMLMRIPKTMASFVKRDVCIDEISLHYSQFVDLGNILFKFSFGHWLVIFHLFILLFIKLLYKSTIGSVVFFNLLTS